MSGNVASRSMRVTLNVSPHDDDVAATRLVQWRRDRFTPRDSPDMIIADEGLYVLADFMALKAKDKVL